MSDITHGEFFKKLVEAKFASTSAFAKKVKKSRTRIQNLYKEEKLTLKMAELYAPFLNVQPMDILQCNFNVLIDPNTIVSEPQVEYGENSDRKKDKQIKKLNMELEFTKKELLAAQREIELLKKINSMLEDGRDDKKEKLKELSKKLSRKVG